MRKLKNCTGVATSCGKCGPEAKALLKECREPVTLNPLTGPSPVLAAA